MKKYFLTIILVTLIIPQLAFATSGACSYHSGVNCSAGASYYGKVQCNDGWVNSSVYFSDAQECQKSSCVYPTQGSCDVEYWKQQAQKEADRINNQNRIMSVMNGLSGSPMQPATVDWTQNFTYLSCENKQALHQLQLDIYDRCITRELGRLVTQTIDTSVKITDSYCKQSSGEQSYLNTNTNKCACGVGYWLKEGRCVEPKSYCSNTLGSNSHAMSDICVCDDGYNGYSGKCTENYKDEKTIDYEVKLWLDQGGRCNNNSIFSVKQQQDCVLYQTNPNTYNWKVLDKIETPKAEDHVLKQQKIINSTEVTSKEVVLRSTKHIAPEQKQSTTTIKNVDTVVSEPIKIEIKKPSWFSRLFSWFK